jgi:hypothetical protein
MIQPHVTVGLLVCDDPEGRLERDTEYLLSESELESLRGWTPTSSISESMRRTKMSDRHQ